MRAPGPLTTLVCLAAAALTSGCAGDAAKPATKPAPKPTVSVSGSADRIPTPTWGPVHGLPLPGAGAGGVHMDVIAYDPAHHRVWVPAGGTGCVDVIDAGTHRITQVKGFPTRVVKWRGHVHHVGPSAAAVGPGVVYVGSRGDSSVYAIDAATLKVTGHTKLAGSPDLLAVSAAAHEVWVTTPRSKAIVVLDAKTLAKKATVPLAGHPEGLVIDDMRGIVYTNLEDRDRTLAIDLHTRKVVHDWPASAGADGPKCLALDPVGDFLLVACPDHVNVIDPAHAGRLLSSIDTGRGVDAIDYVPGRHELYAAAGRAGQLTVARLDRKGVLTALAVVKTAPGARNAVATEAGVAYLTDSRRGQILVVQPVREVR